MGGRSPRSIEPWEMLARAKYVLPTSTLRLRLAGLARSLLLRLSLPESSFLVDSLTMIADVVNSAKGAATFSTYHTDHGDVALSAGRSSPPDWVSKAQRTRYVDQSAYTCCSTVNAVVLTWAPRKQRYSMPKRPHLWPLPIRRSGLCVQPRSKQNKFHTRNVGQDFLHQPIPNHDLQP